MTSGFKYIVLGTFVSFLVGCVGTEPASNISELNDLAEKATTEKSLKNVFKILEEFDSLGELDNLGIRIFNEDGYKNRDIVDYNNAGICSMLPSKEYRPYPDYSLTLFAEIYGFYPIYPHVKNASRKEHTLSAKYKQMSNLFFDKSIIDTISVKERALLQQCWPSGGYRWTGDAKCDGFRKEYFAAKKNTRCLFNYKNFLPDDIKISSYGRLVQLYIAYKQSIEECDNNNVVKTGEYVCNADKKCSEVERELSPEEKQQCYDDVERKLNDIAKSGDL